MMAELPSREELIICLLNNDINSLYKKPYLKKALFGRSGKNLLHLAAKLAVNTNTLQFLVYKTKLSPSKFTNLRKRLAIHIACKHGNLNNVQNLLNLYPKSLNQKDYSGNSPLSVACKYRHLEISQFLVSQGADLCLKNKQILCPLRICAQIAEINIMDLLIGSLDSQNWAAVKINCLALAVGTENNEFVSFLLSKLDFKETCILSSLNSVLKACKSVRMMKVVLDFIKGNRISKLMMMLELNADCELIFEYCESELRGLSIKVPVMYDRADLLAGMYRMGMIRAEELLGLTSESLKEKCEKYLSEFKRWQQTKNVIFVKKYCKKECTNRLQLSLIRQLLTYI